MIINYRVAIIKKLNLLLSYKNISYICNIFNNDFLAVVNFLNKTIKYAFLYPHFFDDPDFFSLENLIKNVLEHPDIDDEYQRYVKKKIHLTGPLNLNKEFDFPYDSDICLNDIVGLRMYSLEEIQKICKSNNKINEHRLALKTVLEAKFKFEHQDMVPAFTYNRAEYLTIDRDFAYYHSNLTGDIDTDFYILYNDERLHNKPYLDSDYYDNIKKISNAVDFEFAKIGNMYQINNGRHRILYVLKNRLPVTIKAIVKHRIEDKEFNDILNELKVLYNIKVVKNNVLNDDADVLIIFNSSMYRIKDKKELIDFKNKLDSNESLNDYFLVDYYDFLKGDFSFQIIEYAKIIYEEYLANGSEVIINNYSDFILRNPTLNNFICYNSFVYLQELYGRSIVYQFDFNALFERIYDINQKRKLEKI